MLVFLVLIGFLALILYRQIMVAFLANPGLNGLILGVLLIGSVLAIRQVVRLVPEVRWVNALRSGGNQSMQGNADAAVMFDDLKNGLAAPIAGMSISFTSSLFGLAGSLVLGFLDLQAGQAQNRFYTELEDRLSMYAIDAPLDPLARSMDAEARALHAAQTGGTGQESNVALATLAEGIHGLVVQMRQEQQQIRDWVEAQSAQQRELKAVLERLAAEAERH